MVCTALLQRVVTRAIKAVARQKSRQAVSIGQRCHSPSLWGHFCAGARRSRRARSAMLCSVRLPEALARRCSRSLPRCCHGNPFSPLGRQLQSLPLSIFRRGIVPWAIARRAECRIAFGTRPETRNRAEPRRFRAIEIQPLQGLIWGRTRSVIAAGLLAALRLRRAASASAVRRGRRAL